MTDPDDGEDRDDRTDGVLLPPIPFPAPEIRELPDPQVGGAQHPSGDALSGEAAQHHPGSESGAQHLSRGAPSDAALRHQASGERGAQHLVAGELLGQVVQHQAAGESGAQHVAAGELVGGGQRPPGRGLRGLRGLRHLSNVQLAIAVGAVVAAVVAAVVIVNAQRDDDPEQSVAAGTVTLAPPAAADTTSAGTVVGTVAPTDAPTTVAVLSPETTDAVATSEGTAPAESSESVDSVASLATVAADAPPVPDAACASEASFRSDVGVDVASLLVVNNTAETVQAIWLDYDGARVLYDEVAPFTSYEQPTWLTHPWIVANLQGACYRLVVMTSLEQTVTVDPG